MKIDDIREIIEMIERSGVAELDITENDEAIHIERSRSRVSPHYINATATATTTTNELVEAGDITPDDYVVRSPMVGTFCRATTLDAKPFVEVGDIVKGDNDLCIISALHIQNPIKSGLSGRISAILVEDAQPVEYDQALFVISRHQDAH